MIKGKQVKQPNADPLAADAAAAAPPLEADAASPALEAAVGVPDAAPLEPLEAIEADAVPLANDVPLASWVR